MGIFNFFKKRKKEAVPEEEQPYTKEDEEKVKERLKGLGYL